MMISFMWDGKDGEATSGAMLFHDYPEALENLLNRAILTMPTVIVVVTDGSCDQFTWMEFLERGA